MPYLIYPSAYNHSEDFNAEVFVNYQLNYLVDSALFSLNHILSADDSWILAFENSIQYYRFFVDHLMMCLGQIHDYFESNKAGIQDFIKPNRNLYNFTKSEFPIIAEKKPRNLIEHLGERNNITIKNCGAVGGFNVLFPESDKKLNESINNKKECYPYTLDMNKKCIIFSDNNNRTDGNFEYYNVGLIPLKEELLELKNRIIDLKDKLSSLFI